MDQNQMKILCIKFKLAMNFLPPTTDRLQEPANGQRRTRSSSSKPYYDFKQTWKKNLTAVGLKRNTWIMYIDFPQHCYPC